jgi:hypothetical protein
MPQQVTTHAHVNHSTAASAFSVQDGPVWVQILKLLHLPERFVETLQRQQQQEADMQELQRLRRSVVELQHRAQGGS